MIRILSTSLRHSSVTVSVREREVSKYMDAWEPNHLCQPTKFGVDDHRQSSISVVGLLGAGVFQTLMVSLLCRLAMVR